LPGTDRRARAFPVLQNSFGRRWTVPALLGFILGVMLTIAAAYGYDSSTGRAANGLSASAAGGQAPMVNWNVVSDDWQNFQTTVRIKAENLERKLKERS
jgi:hypothetical protein